MRGRGAGARGAAPARRVTGAAAAAGGLRWPLVFLAGLRAFGRCSAGSAATRESDGAAIVATRISSVAAAGEVRGVAFSATAAWFGRMTAAAENAATNIIAATRARTAAIGRSLMSLPPGTA